jgi:Ni/Co efflux regulator RcnB
MHTLRQRYYFRRNAFRQGSWREFYIHVIDFHRKEPIMKKILSTAIALTLLAGTGTAFAQGHDDHRDNNNAMAMHGPSMAMHGPQGHENGPSHPEWRQGGKIGHDDWGRGSKINYREHHLRKPPRGYEWRQVDNNYVLAAAATGLIASIILASH